jgi:hypothetical protein
MVIEWITQNVGVELNPLRLTRDMYIWKRLLGPGVESNYSITV